MIIFCLFAGMGRAQSVSLYNFDRNTPGVVKANVRAVDKDGKRLPGLTAADFIVKENGRVRKVTLYECPPEAPVNTISAALSIDISGSMLSTFNGGRSVDYAKTTCLNLINALNLPPAEVALQQCNERADLLCDFTTDRAKLLQMLAPIDADGGNDASEHLLNQYSGLLSIAATGKYKRYAILCSDAYMGRLSPPALQRCLDICAQFDITLYAILFNDQATNGNGLRSSLQQVADATGGWLRDGVVTQDAAKEIAMELKGELGGSGPCKIEYETVNMCDPFIVTEITIPKYNLTVTNTKINSLGEGQVDVTPLSLRFGKVNPPLSGEQFVKLEAVGGDVRIRSIATTHPAITIKSNPAPFVINENTAASITIVYTPVDTGFISAYLHINTDYCGDSLALAIPISAGVQPPYELVITQPVGGQLFIAGEDTAITWKGVDPADPVKLEYSSNAGGTWSLIADSAFGLRYPWRVPPPASTQCKVRGTLVEDELNPALNLTLVNRYRIFDSVGRSPTYAELSSDNKQLLVSANGVHLLDALSGKFQSSFTTFNTSAGIPPTSGVGTDAFASSGKTLFGILTGGATWTQSVAGTITSLSRSLDRTSAAVTVQSGGTEIWSFFGPQKGKTVYGHLGDAKNSAFDKASARLATAGADATARVWDIASGGETRKMTLTGVCSAVQFHPMADLLATTTEEGILDIWDIASGASTTNLDVTMTSPDRLMFDATGSTLYVGSSANSVARVLTNDGSGYTTTLVIGDAFTNWNVHAPMTKDGRFILHRAFGNATIVSVWDMKTSKIAGQLAHPGLVRSATFSDDEQYIVTTTDREAFLWQMSRSADSGKKSDTTGRFTVVEPSASAVNVDMGQVLVSAKKDSVVTAYITNTGTYKILIDSLSIAGANPGDFLVQANPPPLIDPGQTANVEFAFTPSAAGLRTAIVKAHIRSGALQQSIVGFGVSPYIETLGNVVDLGVHPIGSTFDSVVSVAVKNVCSSPITILSTDLLGPDKAQFSIVSGGGSFTLIPGATQAIEVRFAPQSLGRASSNIGFAYTGVGSPAVLRLFGQGIGGSVYIPDDSGAAGDIVNIAVLLSGVKTYIQSSGATKFKADIAFDASVLTPVNDAARGTIMNGIQTISIADTWSSTNDTLTIIPMRVGLGAYERTTVNMPNFHWLDESGNELPIAVEVRPGTFKLTELCEEGGKRLFNPEGQISLSIHPNPGSGSTITIAYETIEAGPTTLTVYSAVGSTVTELLTDEPSVYQETLSTSSLPSGAYYCILRTPTATLRKQFFIGK